MSSLWAVASVFVGVSFLLTSGAMLILVLVLLRLIHFPALLQAKEGQKDEGSAAEGDADGNYNHNADEVPTARARPKYSHAELYSVDDSDETIQAPSGAVSYTITCKAKAMGILEVFVVNLASRMIAPKMPSSDTLTGDVKKTLSYQRIDEIRLLRRPPTRSCAAYSVAGYSKEELAGISDEALRRLGVSCAQLKERLRKAPGEKRAELRYVFKANCCPVTKVEAPADKLFGELPSQAPTTSSSQSPTLS